MTAACVAATEGLRVMLVEKTPFAGGTTSRSAGTAWIPGNFSMSGDAARADIDAARLYLDTLVGERSRRELLDSVERMNRYAVAGEDPDFGKGSDRLSRQNGDPSNAPNPCLGPIATPPFYAVEVAPANLGTSLGLETNENAHLLDATGSPLPCLYACGNDMNSIMGGQYPAPGVTLGPALTFGYVAAMHAAGKLQ